MLQKRPKARGSELWARNTGLFSYPFTQDYAASAAALEQLEVVELRH
jgi:hypothetical protein